MGLCCWEVVAAKGVVVRWLWGSALCVCAAGCGACAQEPLRCRPAASAGGLSETLPHSPTIRRGGCEALALVVLPPTIEGQMHC